jgi:hypothetical protein
MHNAATGARDRGFPSRCFWARMTPGSAGERRGPRGKNMAEIPIAAAPGGAIELRIGALFGRSFGVFSRHFIPFCLLGAVGALPYLLPASPNRGNSLWVSLLVPLLMPVTQAIVLYGAFQDMRGRPFGIGESVKRGLSRFFPVIGLAICLSIGIVLGFLLLIIPGMIFETMFFVALPACMIERLGPIQSMSRSAELTKGLRWKVFAVSLLLLGVAAVAAGVFEVLLLRSRHGLPAVIGNFAWQTVFSAYGAIVTAVLYSDLRRTKEGIDLEQIAAVFD